jgi:glycosyltransferase involved in cell wall biosynthesis
MICILHGYLLDGSGSNLWTQAVIRTLCRSGEIVHLMCQEPHPEKFDYVSRAIRYDESLQPTVTFDRQVPYPGECVIHRPFIGDTLPVYVWDEYEEFDTVVPMVDLDDVAIEAYIARNTALLESLVGEYGISAIHANHAVLMSVVARRVCASKAVPFTIMPHGSAIEYAVKKDRRLHALATEAFAEARNVFVIGPEIRRRVREVFSEVPKIERKLVDLNLGVDTSLFEPVATGERQRSIDELGRALEGLERGKRGALTEKMRDGLGGDLDRDALRGLLAVSAGYNGKLTDADCEEKLHAVDWKNEQIILFVGRLITGKGIQGVVAALPAILRRSPGTRLIVSGHGPLREPLEAMLWALQTGDRELFDNIVRWGSDLEGERDPEPLLHVERYMAGMDEDELEAYWTSARQARVSEKVVFTGYLTHRELRYLFPCCDVAVFPSIVAEAGPLVFLEAIASGVFPMGIYIAGMAASIDSLAEVVPRTVSGLMKLRPEPDHTVVDIVSNVTGALALGRKHAGDLRRTAIEKYDWEAVGRKFLNTLTGG